MKSEHLESRTLSLQILEHSNPLRINPKVWVKLVDCLKIKYKFLSSKLEEHERMINHTSIFVAYIFTRIAKVVGSSKLNSWKAQSLFYNNLSFTTKGMGWTPSMYEISTHTWLIHVPLCRV